MIRLGTRNLLDLWVQCAVKSPSQSKIRKTLNLQAKPTWVEYVRTTTFFNKLNAEAIWKSGHTVSNAGKKRGRGRAILKKPVINLNRGQQLGVGRANIRWPGLNAPIIQGQDVVDMEKLPEDPEFQKKLVEARKAVGKKTRAAVHPLERGWSGRSIMGKSLGPPEVIEHMTDFDSYVLEVKHLQLFTSNLGKVRGTGVLVVVGNRKGLIGISAAKGVDSKTAIRKAQLRAVKKLFHIKLEEKHTVNHDFFYQFGITKLFVYKKPLGYGLVCNRGIAVCCNLLGITDLYAKVEKSTNKQNVVKAFLLGLLEQKTYQQMADENKLHLVEQRKETHMFPKVLASPAEVLKKKDHSLLFQQYIMDGKLPLKVEPKPVTHVMPNYARHLKRTNYARNHKEVKLRLLAEHGKFQSHLTEIYPECQAPFLGKIHKGAETDETETS